jgi:hypothetical protein
MFNRSHLTHSILLASLGLAMTWGASMARADASYFGRWTVSDEKPVFSAKGKFYKTIDIAACGADFCGVAVSDGGECGPTLFRFLTAHATNEQLIGHGLWGAAKKRLEIDYIIPDTEKPYVTLGLGDKDMDLTGREGSMPTFQANYKTAGDATCKVD